MTADIEPRSIDLAQEPTFKLADVEVHPATLEVVAGERREPLEPRIMQVLVALARRRGEVVSREELNELCWGGRVVGDDAVNRCIGRLRKLAQTHGGFTVETVPRVGYRLTEATGRPWARLLRERRALAALAVVALVLALGASLWAWRAKLAVEDPAESRVAIRKFDVIGDDAEAHAFAARLADEIASVSGENAVGFIVLGPVTNEGLGSANLVLGGAVSREAGMWRVRAYLEDRKAKATLWSNRFERPVEDGAELRGQIAVAVTEILYTAQDTARQRGLTLDPTTRALYLKAGAALGNPQLPFTQDEAVRAAEQVVARAPDFAAAHAQLAAALVFSANVDRAEVVGRVKSEAARAIAIDPRTSGGAYDALFVLARREAPLQLASAEDVLLRGIAASPEYPITQMRECSFLQEVGRIAEAVRYCERARALRPLAAVIGWRYALGLYSRGETELAAQAIARSARLNPDHIQTRRIRFEVEAFDGSPNRALALLHDPELRPQTFRPQAVHPLELLIKALQSGTAADADRAIAALWTASRSGDIDPRYLILGAARIGRTEDAFRALAQFGPIPAKSIGGSVLFEPAAEPLRRDPRFWPLAAKAGYVRYWKTRGVWPDFCSDPAYRVDCPKEAARLS